jgi:hypothetical protein
MYVSSVEDRLKVCSFQGTTQIAHQRMSERNYSRVSKSQVIDPTIFQPEKHVITGRPAQILLEQVLLIKRKMQSSNRAMTLSFSECKFGMVLYEQS